MEDLKPYKNISGSKKEQIAKMFDNIAVRYDFLNHLLSGGIDKLWRRKAIRLLNSYKPAVILDIASGTGDFAIEALRMSPKKIYGIDLSKVMVELGKKKIKRLNLEDEISLELGDSENMRFESGMFDATTVSFGIRNFENITAGLMEMNRVLKKDGHLLILEFSNPQRFPIKQMYKFYFEKILPFVGRVFSKDKFAYTYLYESVRAFPDNDKFVEVLKKCNFKNIVTKSLSFGIATIYLAQK